MKKMYSLRMGLSLAMIAILLLNPFAAALAESYMASVIRLLNYEGEVVILDESGNSRFLMENVRFNSGESLSTGAGAMASVGLDAAKVLTLDSMTQVTFRKESNRMTLSLASGRLLLDVQEKLDDNESFDIQTSTMAVGIRGTVVYLTSFDGSEEEINRILLESNQSFREVLNRTLPYDYFGSFSQLVVLEGTAVATFETENGRSRSVEVHAGEKITVTDQNRASADVRKAKASDLGEDMLEFIQGDPELTEKVEQASDLIDTSSTQIDENAQPSIHTHNYSTSVEPATCDQDGTTVYTCACGDSYTEASPKALGHLWGDWETVTEPTCTEAGERRRTCRRAGCGSTQTETIPAAGHSLITDPGIEPTCTESGWTEHIYCAVCEEVMEPYQTEIPALGHDWGEWATVEEANCGAEGLKRRTCRRTDCGAEEEETIPATGAHTAAETPVQENYVAETCTTGTSYDEVTYCTVCGAELLRQPYATDAPGHLWGDWETTTEPSCTEAGERQRTCQRAGCGATETETIPAAGHSPVEADKPTCTRAGYTGRTYCSVCGALVSPGTPAPALGGEHNYQAVGSTFSNTYVNSDGITMIQLCQSMVCTICGYGYAEILDEWEEGAHSIDPGT